jgi:hypothetical protein
MSSFMKIAAMFVLSTPLALAGCMGDVDDAEQNDPAAQPLAGGDAQFTFGKQGPAEQNPAMLVNPSGEQKFGGGGQQYGGENPCLVPPINAPIYSVPVTQAPTYPAPRFGAPKHEAPVYKAPAYQSPTYQYAGQVPASQAPRYEAPSYPGPTYQAPVYEAPIYEAPSFPAPIFERATYQECQMLPAWQLSPCAHGYEHLLGGEQGQGLMQGGDLQP